MVKTGQWRAASYTHQTPKTPWAFHTTELSQWNILHPSHLCSGWIIKQGSECFLAGLVKIRARRGAVAPGSAWWTRPPWSATSCAGWRISWRALHVDPWWGVHTAPLSRSGKRWCPRVWNARPRLAPSTRRHTAPPTRPGRPPRRCLQTHWPPVGKAGGGREYNLYSGVYRLRNAESSESEKVQFSIFGFICDLDLIKA